MSEATGPVPGDPEAIRSRAGELASLAAALVGVADALGEVTTSGWTGRAAERFRERFDADPPRWRAAGIGMSRVATALEHYAAALERAQQAGDRPSMPPSALPPERDAGGLGSALGPDGDAITGRAEAQDQARVEQERAARRAIEQLRRVADLAPERRAWSETGLRFLGAVVTGAIAATGDPARVLTDLDGVADLGEVAARGPEATDAAGRLGLDRWLAAALHEQSAADPAGVGTRIAAALAELGPGADGSAAAGALRDALASVLDEQGSAVRPDRTPLPWPLDEATAQELSALSLDQLVAHVTTRPDWDEVFTDAAAPGLPAERPGSPAWGDSWLAGSVAIDEPPASWPPEHAFHPGPAIVGAGWTVGAAPAGQVNPEAGPR